MTSEIAAMLDELMGRGRNEEAGKQADRVSYKDPEVCHYYVCGFCPHELFVNTRADLGPCKKIHDEAIRKEYQTSDDVFKLGYEERFYDFLTDCVVEVERRIKRNKMRLDSTNGRNDSNETPESAEAAQKLSQLQIEISNLLVEVERLGEQGEVQNAMAKTAQVDKLKEERERIRQRHITLTQQNAPEMPQSYNGIQEKQMEVCEICGSFLIVGDAQARVDDHLMGKQHMGYARMRAKIAQLKDFIDKKRDSRRSSRRSEDRNKDEKEKVGDDRSEDRSKSRRESRTDDRSESRSYRDERRGSRHERRRSSDRSSGRRRHEDDRRRHEDHGRHRDDRDRERRRRRTRSRSREKHRDERRSSKSYHRNGENGTR